MYLLKLYKNEKWYLTEKVLGLLKKNVFSLKRKTTVFLFHFQLRNVNLWWHLSVERGINIIKESQQYLLTTKNILSLKHVISLLNNKSFSITWNKILQFSKSNQIKPTKIFLYVIKYFNVHCGIGGAMVSSIQ